MQPQEFFDRIEVAGDVASIAQKQFVQPDHYLTKPDPGSPIQRLMTATQRALILQIKTRLIIKVCSIELDISVERQAPSVDPDDLPDTPAEAVGIVERFASDAEEAFSELLRRLRSAIATNKELFWPCLSDLLQHLDSTDEDYWEFVATTVESSNFKPGNLGLDQQIRGAVKLLDVLDNIRTQVPDMVEQLNIDKWVGTALQRLYDAAAPVIASKNGNWQYSSSGDKTDVLAGQAVVQIWQFDPEYKDTRSWFAPSHNWWPFHLPGKPQVMREHALPPGQVTIVAFLPWESDMLVVAMEDGQVLLFDREHVEPVREFATRLYPSVIGYTDLAMMVYGPSAYERSGHWYRWLILGPKGRSVADVVITERTPTDEELKQLESLGRWRRERQLRKLTTCAVPIREGLVPEPENNPGYFTMAQVSREYVKQHGKQGLGTYEFKRQEQETVLRPVKLDNSGNADLFDASKSTFFHLGIDTALSRVAMESRVLYSRNSFLVQPGVDHFAMAKGDQLLALAGNRHVYIYGNVVSRGP